MTDSTKPFIKEHGGENIFFADTLTQASNAFSGAELTDEEKGKRPNSHLLMFGIEGWDKTANVKRLVQGMSAQASTAQFNRIEVFGCEIKDEEFRELAEGFKPENLGSVKRLDIDNTKLSESSAQAIFQNVSEAASIEHLNLQGSVPDEKVLGVISKLLTPECNLTQTLENLDLKLNGLKGEAGEAIGYLMESLNPTQKEKFVLDLFYNELGAAATQVFATKMGAGCRITELDLCCNKIGDAGAIALADALRSNNSLKVLKIALNEITAVGGTAILQVFVPPKRKGGLGRNKTLEILDMSANVMEEKEEVKLEEDPLVKQFEAELKAMPEGTDEEKENKEAKRAEMQKVRLKMLNDNPSLGETLASIIESPGSLKDLDFTGIEFAPGGWIRIANAFDTYKTRGDPLNGGKHEAIYRFSIVDLMNQENLNMMEAKIWTGDLDQQFTFVDWRRPKPTTENKTAEATKA